MFRKQKITVVLALGVVFFFKSYVIVIGQSTLPEFLPECEIKTPDAAASAVNLAEASLKNINTGDVTGRLRMGNTPDRISVSLF